MKLPFTFTNVLNDEKVVIDLYDIAQIWSADFFYDDDTGEKIKLDKDCLIIQMNDEESYVADLSLSNVLYLSKEYWRIKSKIAIKELFKNN